MPLGPAVWGFFMDLNCGGPHYHSPTVRACGQMNVIGTVLSKTPKVPQVSRRLVTFWGTSSSCRIS